MIYHKIPTVYERNPETKFKTLIEGKFATKELEYLAGCRWVFTEKVDGTNIRISIINNKLNVRGRTDNSQIPTFLLTRLNEIFQTEKLQELFPDCTPILYGEGFGDKIQKAGVNYGKSDFVLFDVFIISNSGGLYLDRINVEDIAKKLNIQVVPIIGSGSLRRMVDIGIKGFKSYWGNFIAEGIVARPEIELKDRLGNRIITKIKYKDFNRS